MTKCKRCGTYKDIFSSFEGQTYCLDCVKELRNNKIEEAVENQTNPSIIKVFLPTISLMLSGMLLDDM